MDPNEQQPPVQPVAPQPQTVPQPAQEDPGKTLAIVGIILAFLVAIAGLVVSIIAQKKSVAAGFDGQLAKIGIIINAVMIVINIVVAGILVALTMASYAGIQERALESQRRADAAQQQKEEMLRSFEQE